MRRAVAAASALLLFVGLFTAASLAPTTPVSPAAAASGADFNAGNIISDELFYNYTLMSESGVQSFLEGRVPNCTAAAGAPACLKNYVASSSPRAADQYCGAYAGGTNQRASTIIAQVAQSCNINPQVLLVTLQKERGLVTKTAPNTGDYQISMGYACPDTAACDTRYYGFANQVFSAARQFNVYKKLPTSFNYRAGRTNTIQWHPNASCGSSQVYIENDATAALYNYTPYRPNQAALNNINGTGDGCSSYGNRNFFAYFSDWFGSPNRGNLQSPSFEGGSVYGWGASNGPVNVMTARGTVGQVPNGEWFLATNTPVAGRAITQDVQRTTYAGQTITAKVWVRSESDKPFSGTAAVWGIGNSANEAASVPFTVTNTWTELTIKLPVKGSSHSLIRLDVYMNTTSGSMWMDNASISVGQTPPPENLLNNASFEASFGDWVPGNGFMNRSIYQDTRFVKHGSWFAASNTPVARRSFSQTVNVTGYVGDQYSFSIWLRSADATAVHGRRRALGSELEPGRQQRHRILRRRRMDQGHVDLHIAHQLLPAQGGGVPGQRQRHPVPRRRLAVEEPPPDAVVRERDSERMDDRQRHDHPDRHRRLGREPRGRRRLLLHRRRPDRQCLGGPEPGARDHGGRHVHRIGVGQGPDRDHRRHSGALGTRRHDRARSDPVHGRRHLEVDQRLAADKPAEPLRAEVRALSRERGKHGSHRRRQAELSAYRAFVNMAPCRGRFGPEGTT